MNIDDHEMKDLLRFELTWYGKSEASAEAYSEIQCQLFDVEGTLVSLGDQRLTEENLIIEGDNLDGMKLLSSCYAEGVDLIYMDPPYNTGKDFIYQDRFTTHLKEYLAETHQSSQKTGAPETDGRHHVSWLSMIYPRLLIARKLLSERGVICISIDDHEMHHLRVLLDEVMGEANHIATIIASLNPKGRQFGRFATSHEYLLIYAKDHRECALEYASADLVNPKDFPRSDDSGSYRLLPLRNSNKRFNPETRPRLYYPLYINSASGEVKEEIPGANASSSPDWIEVYPVFGSGAPAVWRWSRAKVKRESNLLVGEIVRGRLGKRWDVKQKDYNHTGRTKKIKSIWLSSEIGSTDHAARELKDLGLEFFETPKPLALLRRLTALMPKDAVILDPFAGSGTTGEATVRQNQADLGTRKYILIQNATPIQHERLSTIASVTRERMRLVQADLISSSRATAEPVSQASYDFQSFYIK